MPIKLYDGQRSPHARKARHHRVARTSAGKTILEGSVSAPLEHQQKINAHHMHICDERFPPADGPATPLTLR
jgi:hypothetical protein